MADENFYKEKLWNEILGEIREIKVVQTSQGKDIADIKMKMNWVFGWASGMAIVFSVGFSIVKDKIWPN
ncbi:hypothetical protein HY967_01570 [Candidatus Jorgensenbacteria bacterium]|nr:hypothetical protein [Candidatus Jorgensenbacteria bacterium]